MANRLTARVQISGASQVQGLLYGLALASLADLRARRLPPLYTSGVRYQREMGEEFWQVPSVTYQRRAGDCEDLVAWRVAELWLAGEKTARPVIKRVRPGLMHCLVMRVDASGKRYLECPSRRLGMNGKG